MKSIYNHNKIASTSVLNFTFSAPHASDLTFKMLDSHCGSVGSSFEGQQHTILLYTLFNHIRNKLSTGPFGLNNKICNSLCKITKKECSFVFVFGSTKTLLKRIVRLLLKELNPTKLGAQYTRLCKNLGFKANVKTVKSEFNHCCDDLIKHLSKATIHASGKIALTKKDFEDMVAAGLTDKVKAQLKPAPKDAKHPRQAPGKPDGETVADVHLSEHKITVGSQYAPLVRDFIGMKTDAHWVGDSIYWCQKSLHLDKVCAEKLVDTYIKKFDKFKEKLPAALTHELLAAGVSGASIKAASKAGLRSAILACGK